MCVYSVVAAVCVCGGGGGVSAFSVSASRRSVFQSGLFLFSVCVKNDSRPCVGDERLLRIGVHVCTRRHISRVRTL